MAASPRMFSLFWLRQKFRLRRNRPNQRGVGAEPTALKRSDLTPKSAKGVWGKTRVFPQLFFGLDARKTNYGPFRQTKPPHSVRNREAVFIAKSQAKPSAFPSLYRARSPTPTDYAVLAKCSLCSSQSCNRNSEG